MEDLGFVFEIELKSLLSEEQYKRLEDELPKKYKLINEDTIHTTKYAPGDYRLRHSDKVYEFINKEGYITSICRKKYKTTLNSMEELNSYIAVFENMELKPYKPWTKYKREFECKLGEHIYVICLQNIHGFAYILKVEYLSDEENKEVHEPNLRKIISDLGCEPITPKEFLDKLTEYIKN
jgi:hypothetical protein